MILSFPFIYSRLHSENCANHVSIWFDVSYNQYNIKLYQTFGLDKTSECSKLNFAALVQDMESDCRECACDDPNNVIEYSGPAKGFCEHHEDSICGSYSFHVSCVTRES